MIRAVVVDDDKDTVALFSEILQGNNINVVGKGYNGQEAAFLYQKLKPDVIFLDVIMPVYDGIYGITKIKEMNPDAVVIITTNQMTINAQICHEKPTLLLYLLDTPLSNCNKKKTMYLKLVKSL